MRICRADFTNSVQFKPAHVWNPNHHVKDHAVYKGTKDSLNNQAESNAVCFLFFPPSFGEMWYLTYSHSLLPLTGIVHSPPTLCLCGHFFIELSLGELKCFFFFFLFNSLSLLVDQ